MLTTMHITICSDSDSILRPQSRVVFVHSARSWKVDLRRDLLNIIRAVAQCMVDVWCICQSKMLLYLKHILP